MEQLEQIDLNCISALECAKTEACVEKTADKIELIRKTEIHKKPVKSRLSKLFKKSNLNAKYIEQLNPIERLKSQQVYRNYGIY